MLSIEIVSFGVAERPPSSPFVSRTEMRSLNSPRAIRRAGKSPHDAEDLTQGFFARLIEKNFLATADGDKGRLRTFLLTCVQRHLADEHDRAMTQKRGGRRIVELDALTAEQRLAAEPADDLTPERCYQNTVEMKTDVDRIRTTPEQQRKPAPKAKSKSPFAIAIIIVCLALASAGGFFIWEKMNASRASRPPAGPASAAESSPALQRAEPSSAAGRPDGRKPPTTLPAAATPTNATNDKAQALVTFISQSPFKWKTANGSDIFNGKNFHARVRRGEKFSVQLKDDTVSPNAGSVTLDTSKEGQQTVQAGGVTLRFEIKFVADTSAVLSVQPTPAAATKDAPFVNSLGMKFVPVPGTRVLFSIWNTRVADYAAYARVNKVDGAWATQHKQGVPVGREPDHPVVGVSWDDAQAFCKWLTEKESAEGRLATGVNYRLPTDEEWSIAVGLPPEAGGTPEQKGTKNDEVFLWGTGFPPQGKVGNYADETYHAKFPPGDKDKNPWLEGYTDGFATISPVGSFPANAFGLYDMGGNVAQWCEDLFNKTMPDRVLRGTPWFYDYRDSLRSAYRRRHIPTLRNAYFGFRCVLAPVAAVPAK